MFSSVDAGRCYASIFHTRAFAWGKVKQLVPPTLIHDRGVACGKQHQLLDVDVYVCVSVCTCVQAGTLGKKLMLRKG